jgi:phosphoribosylformylglycinamidine cyclo-ligase
VRETVVGGSAARAGDVVVGLASSGLPANGYSLVRRLIDAERLPLTDDLLDPTRLYAADVLATLAELRGRGARVGGLAHVTGGGLPANLPRAVAPTLGVRVAVGSWPIPDVFRRVQRAAGIGDAEMRATFNCGIGFAMVVEPDAVDETLAVLGRRGQAAWVIGNVATLDELGARYVEA